MKVAHRAPTRARMLVAFLYGAGRALALARAVGRVSAGSFVTGSGVTVPRPVPVIASRSSSSPATVALLAADQLSATAVAVRRRISDDHSRTRADVTDLRNEQDEHEHALEPYDH